MFAYYLLGITVFSSIILYIVQNWPTKQLTKNIPDATYDYIIVGAGSAGSVLASRLSENPKKKVLLVEAGGLGSRYISEIPLAAPDLQGTELDWSHLIEPQKNACFAFTDNQFYLAQGKTLGGSSSINFMIYTRGSPHDYDGWAAKGCEGWSYKEVMPYFLKSEGMITKKLLKNKDYHKEHGPLTVDEIKTTRLANLFVEAGVELGYRKVDYNSEEQIGVGYTQGNIKKGTRWGTYKAFLKPAMERKNLHVVPQALVRKGPLATIWTPYKQLLVFLALKLTIIYPYCRPFLLPSRGSTSWFYVFILFQVLVKNKRAIGIELMKNDTIYKVKSKGDVILSAGAIGTPKLLMLSGIGPKQHLEDIGIDVVADLPVGLHLQDHVYPFGVQHFIKKEMAITESNTKTFWALVDFLLLGEGILSSSGVEGTAFFESKYQPQDDLYPYIQLHLLASLITTLKEKQKRKLIKKNLNMKGKVFDALCEDLVDRHGFVMLPILLHPKSEGFVKLKSKDPMDPPLIDPKYLSHTNDIQVLLEGIRIAEKFIGTYVMSSIGSKPFKRIHPFCKEHEYGSDNYWLCFIKQNLITLYHPTGTCKMGPVNDNTTVVDPKLRVKGIANLRVVDASIMPEITSGNTNAPTIMIAEKAADIITGNITVKPWKEDTDEEFKEFDVHLDKHDEL